MATTGGTGKSAGAGAGAADDVAGVGELSYSDAGQELDAIIEEFETGIIDVDRLVDQLERATEIVDELDRRLRRTRMQVEELVPRLEAIGQRDRAEDGMAPDQDGVFEDGVLEDGVPEDDGAGTGGGVSPGLF